VLIVGNPARADIYEAADRAQSRLGLPVNPVIRGTKQWQDGAEALVAQIKSGAHVVVHPTKSRYDAAAVADPKVRPTNAATRSPSPPPGDAARRREVAVG